MIRKGNECHTINNAIFLNKQADKSRKSHNEKFTLSTANFRTVGFPPSIDTNTASSGKFLFTSANINFSSKLITRFEKTAKEFASDAQIHKNYSQNCKHIHYSSFWRNKLTTEVSNLICHVAKVKAARSALSMADVIHFF